MTCRCCRGEAARASDLRICPLCTVTVYMPACMMPAWLRNLHSARSGICILHCTTEARACATVSRRVCVALKPSFLPQRCCTELQVRPSSAPVLKPQGLMQKIAFDRTGPKLAVLPSQQGPHRASKVDDLLQLTESSVASEPESRLQHGQ